jgi:hypothetical protein
MLFMRKAGLFRQNKGRMSLKEAAQMVRVFELTGIYFVTNNPFLAVFVF